MARKSNSVSSLRNKYKSIFRDFFELRFYLITAISIFFLSSLIGFFFPGSFSFLDSILKKIELQVQGLDLIQTIVFIFQNNLSSSFYALILGVFLGIIPIFNAMLNGVLLGYVVAKASSVEGLVVIWRLVPHGIFELPAIFLSISLGIRLGFFIFSKNPKEAFLTRLRSSLLAFLYVILPLLIIAAIVEGFLVIFF